MVFAPYFPAMHTVVGKTANGGFRALAIEIIMDPWNDGSMLDTPRDGPVALDDTSKAIIEILQIDGRRSYSSIAKDVGLSEAAVRQRVSRLLEQGVMQIVAVTDPLTIGFKRQAMVGLRVEGDTQAVAAELCLLDEVDYVVITAGSFDIILEIVCADDEQLLETLSHRIRAIPTVRSTETFIYLKLAKQTYAWGAR
jgi:Lrp/AsnC family transcriptional regulator, regulator for asnA, asnC and gidA